MKQILRTIPILLVLVFTSILSSCNDDDNKTTYQAFGLAYPMSRGGYNFKIVTDNGHVLFPAGSSVTIKNTCRVYSTFTFVNDNDVNKDSAEVNFNYINKLLYKPITNQDTSLGHSPIYVSKNKIWQSQCHPILNIPFEYEGGQEKHMVSLYYNSETSSTDTVMLEFRHNDNSDSYHKRLSGLVCYDLSCIEDFVTVTDSIVYTVTINRGTTQSYINKWSGVYKKN